MKVCVLPAFVVAIALVVAGPASARRPATSSERAEIAAAVLKWEQRDELLPSSGRLSMVAPAHWAAKQRCHFQRAYVSTVDTRWAVFWFRSKYRESDSRYATCVQSAGYVDGVWVLKRTASRSWAVTGWIYGERSGYCRAIAATGIPLAAFNDAHGPGLGSTCKP